MEAFHFQQSSDCKRRITLTYCTESWERRSIQSCRERNTSAEYYYSTEKKKKRKLVIL